jgi:NDP-sugar pyrophosphorylase family protein
MKGMILAAGYGERLWPLTADRTKPAIPVLGKPIVGYVAEYLAQFGIQDVVVNLHHRPESVKRALGDGRQFGVKLEYIHEPVILGTSGAMDNARQLLAGDRFVVINGKIITDIDLNAALKEHQRQGALATLVLLKNRRREKFSIVETHEGLVTGFAGMPTASFDAATGAEPLMFTGIQILEPRIFDYIPRGIFSHSTIDVYPQAIAKGERIVAHVSEGSWYELSTLQRYLDISLALLKNEGVDTYCGLGAFVSESADVRESILWDNVTIEAGTRVRRSVVGDGVRIRSGQNHEHEVIVRADIISGLTPPARALKGTMHDENFVVSLSQ